MFSIYTTTTLPLTIQIQTILIRWCTHSHKPFKKLSAASIEKKKKKNEKTTKQNFTVYHKYATTTTNPGPTRYIHRTTKPGVPIFLTNYYNTTIQQLLLLQLQVQGCIYTYIPREKRNLRFL